MPRRKTHGEYELQVKDKAPHIVVTGRYDGNRKPISHYCLKHEIEWDVSPFNFLQHPTGFRCCQDEALNAHHLKTRKSNEQFVKEVVALGTGIVPLCEYNGCHEDMSFMCINKHVWESTPHDILSGYGCPYCSGQKVWKGYNDLWTTHPEFAIMLKDPNVGFEISRGSNQCAEWICPDCGTIKMDSPKEVVAYGFRCSKCSDGISYPNKFMAGILKQLHIDYTPEYSPEWIKPYRYDFLIHVCNSDILIELDGGIGHGKIDFITGEQDINGLRRDMIKNEAAKEHNFELIRVDCDYPNVQHRFEYIKNSILNSRISCVLDLSKINWEQCNRYATKSLQIEAARLYDSGSKICEISNALHIAYNTIYQWLKRLSKEGLCSYEPVIGRSKKQ